MLKKQELYRGFFIRDLIISEIGIIVSEYSSLITNILFQSMKLFVDASCLYIPIEKIFGSNVITLQSIIK